MNIVILAAGMGRRMRSERPKVLHTLAGRPMLSHVIERARGISPSAHIIVVYGHGGEAVPRTIGDPSLTWVVQNPQLGTGHAVMQAVPALDDAHPTLVLYGDVPLTRVETLVRLAEAAAGGLALLTVELDDPTGYGRIVRDASGHIRQIVEHRDADDTIRAIREVNTGILIAPTLALKRWLAGLDNRNAQGEYYLTDVVAAAVAEGVPVSHAQPDELWETLGVNSRAQLAALERVHQTEIARQLLEDGVALADPARIDVRGRLVCGQDVSIDVNCVFEGEVEIGAGASIGAHCVIRDARIGPGTEILPFTHIDGATIGEGARIGPYARLRPGTVLGTATHVGNFVEMKNTRMGQGSKANHLAYVGDAEVGERVNIGAGTITCNYDGVNKHKTVIEDDAFIGSDTQLVAPVRVGKGATLGAGTTLTKDAPAERLTVSRARQTTLEGWSRPQRKQS
jgi:bifunctional UDP-N-acetylglucosamine pyrophosphorylase/glucosamine-1-phosphate N-acetyltransferase